MHAHQSRRFVVSLALVVASLGLLAAPDITLPNRPDTLKFAVIGDSGTGSSSQYRVAQQLWASHASYPYEFVVMLGDNLYGGERRQGLQEEVRGSVQADARCETQVLRDARQPRQPEPAPVQAVQHERRTVLHVQAQARRRFFALDSNYMDRPQLAWLEKELAASGSDWKIAFFHHPIYSSGGKHGSDLELRQLLEPLFLKYGVDVVLAGHEHFYERIKPQKGIYYFISGGAAKLREGDVGPRSELTAKGFDTGYHFMSFPRLRQMEKARTSHRMSGCRGAPESTCSNQ